MAIVKNKVWKRLGVGNAILTTLTEGEQIVNLTEGQNRDDLINIVQYGSDVTSQGLLDVIADLVLNDTAINNEKLGLNEMISEGVLEGTIIYTQSYPVITKIKLYSLKDDPLNPGNLILDTLIETFTAPVDKSWEQDNKKKEGPQLEIRPTLPLVVGKSYEIQLYKVVSSVETLMATTRLINIVSTAKTYATEYQRVTYPDNPLDISENKNYYDPVSLSAGVLVPILFLDCYDGIGGTSHFQYATTTSPLTFTVEPGKVKIDLEVSEMGVFFVDSPTIFSIDDIQLDGYYRRDLVRFVFKDTANPNDVPYIEYAPGIETESIPLKHTILSRVLGSYIGAYPLYSILLRKNPSTHVTEILFVDQVFEYSGMKSLMSLENAVPHNRYNDADVQVFHGVHQYLDLILRDSKGRPLSFEFGNDPVSDPQEGPAYIPDSALTARGEVVKDDLDTLNESSVFNFPFMIESTVNDYSTYKDVEFYRFSVGILPYTDPDFNNREGLELHVYSAKFFSTSAGSYLLNVNQYNVTGLSDLPDYGIIFKGYKEVLFTSAISGSGNSGLAPLTTYYFKLQVDGGALTEYSITTGSGTTTFSTLASLLTAAASGAVWAVTTGGRLRCTSNTTGYGSALDFANGTSGLNLFTALTGYNGLGVATPATAVAMRVNDFANHKYTYSDFDTTPVYIESGPLGDSGLGVGKGDFFIVASGNGKYQTLRILDTRTTGSTRDIIIFAIPHVAINVGAKIVMFKSSTEERVGEYLSSIPAEERTPYEEIYRYSDHTGSLIMPFDDAILGHESWPTINNSYSGLPGQPLIYGEYYLINFPSKIRLRFNKWYFVKVCVKRKNVPSPVYNDKPKICIQNPSAPGITTLNGYYKTYYNENSGLYGTLVDGQIAIQIKDQFGDINDPAFAGNRTALGLPPYWKPKAKNLDQHAPERPAAATPPLPGIVYVDVLSGKFAFNAAEEPAELYVTYNVNNLVTGLQDTENMRHYDNAELPTRRVQTVSSKLRFMQDQIDDVSEATAPTLMQYRGAYAEVKIEEDDITKNVESSQLETGMVLAASDSHAIDIVGNYLVAGQYLYSTDAGRVNAYKYNSTTLTWEWLQSISSPMASARFGESVCLYNDLLIVGAPGVNRAYIYRNIADVWTLEYTCNPGLSGNNFGFSVAIYGTVAMVGAYNTTNGSVYVYTYSGGSWSQTQILTASDGASSDYFGYSIALYDTRVVIGAPQDDIGANVDQGSAYVFDLTGGTWLETQKLAGDDSAANDKFGSQVAIYNDKIVISASVVSKVYIFHHSTTWTQKQRITDNGGFGYAIDLYNDRFIVSAPTKTIDGNTNQGAAYRYRYYENYDCWLQEDHVVLTEDGASSYCGASGVALTDTFSVVTINITNSFKVYWKHNTDFTIQVGRLLKADTPGFPGGVKLVRLDQVEYPLTAIEQVYPISRIWTQLVDSPTDRWAKERTEAAGQNPLEPTDLNYFQVPIRNLTSLGFDEDSAQKVFMVINAFENADYIGTGVPISRFALRLPYTYNRLNDIGRHSPFISTDWCTLSFVLHDSDDNPVLSAANGAEVIVTLGTTDHYGYNIHSSNPRAYVEFGLTGKSLSDNTGLSPSTTYWFTINVNGAGVVEHSITTGSGTVTFENLIDLLNAAVSGAEFTLVGGDVRCTSDRYGSTSSIVLGNGIPTHGYQDVNFGTSKSGTDDTGLQAETYDFTLTLDGVGSTTHSITVSSGLLPLDFNGLIALLNAQTPGATWSMASGKLRCTSDATGSSSAISLGHGPVNDLFADPDLTGFSSFATAVNGDPHTTVWPAITGFSAFEAMISYGTIFPGHIEYIYDNQLGDLWAYIEIETPIYLGNNTLPDKRIFHWHVVVDTSHNPTGVATSPRLKTFRDSILDSYQFFRKTYYRPIAGVYGTYNAPYMINNDLTPVVAVNASGLDYINKTTNTPPEWNRIDIMPVDFSDEAVWKLWAYEKYIGVDSRLGRIKFSDEYLAFKGDLLEPQNILYVEFNATWPPAYLNEKSIKTEENINVAISDKKTNHFHIQNDHNLNRLSFVDASVPQRRVFAMETSDGYAAPPDSETRVLAPFNPRSKIRTRYAYFERATFGASALEMDESPTPNLYRVSASRLRTDGDFEVGVDLEVYGNLIVHGTEEVITSEIVDGYQRAHRFEANGLDGLSYFEYLMNTTYNSGYKYLSNGYAGAFRLNKSNGNIEIDDAVSGLAAGNTTFIKRYEINRSGSHMWYNESGTLRSQLDSDGVFHVRQIIEIGSNSLITGSRSVMIDFHSMDTPSDYNYRMYMGSGDPYFRHVSNETVGNNTNVTLWESAAGETLARIWRSTNTTPDDIASANGRFCSGRIYAAVYNDYAETVPSDGTTELRGLVQVDKTSPTYRVTKYKGDFDALIGIRSEDPAMIVGYNTEYENPIFIALKGMVWLDIPYKHAYKVGDRCFISRDGAYHTVETLRNNNVHPLDYKELGTVIEVEETKIRLFL